MINDDTNTQLSRRAFLGQSGIGLGALATTSLLSEAYAGQSGNRELPHFPAKAKRVIYLFQSRSRDCTAASCRIVFEVDSA
mgnify:CR=1 FL=1